MIRAPKNDETLLQDRAPLIASVKRGNIGRFYYCFIQRRIKTAEAVGCIMHLNEVNCLVRL